VTTLKSFCNLFLVRLTKTQMSVQIYPLFVPIKHCTYQTKTEFSSPSRREEEDVSFEGSWFHCSEINCFQDLHVPNTKMISSWTRSCKCFEYDKQNQTLCLQSLCESSPWIQLRREICQFLQLWTAPSCWHRKKVLLL